MSDDRWFGWHFLKKYLLAFDFLLATPVFVNLAWLLPPTISTTLAKDLFAAAMSVLSITFSVFFAALAVIISGSDNDFVRFLEEDGSYTKITETFRFTLEAIFLALLMSVFGFGLASAQVANQCSEQSKWFLVGFSFFFLYSLLAALGIARDSITYARFRTQFLRSRPQDPRGPNDLGPDNRGASPATGPLQTYEAGAVSRGDRADPRGGHDAAGAAQTKELERRARKLLGVRR